MESAQKPVFYWLISGCLLVALMVVVGGVTRLTQSGLSMVEWNLIMGSIPPLNEGDWDEVFETYKTSPEFRIVNPDFTVNDFKTIFWWEYLHRLLGRLIGLIFVIPFVIFLFQGRIDRRLLPKLLVILGLGAFQGFMGWFMVKSGLIDNPSVSHYRLAAHLIIALVTFGFILWVALGFLPEKNKLQHYPSGSESRWVIASMVILFLQILFGALVAGLKAGLYYNTWPTMNGQWVPQEVFSSIGRSGVTAIFENITAVQFIHRWMAIVFLVIIVTLWAKVRRKRIEPYQRICNYLLITSILQMLIGIFTLINKIPIVLATLHQLGGLALVAGLVVLLHRFFSSRLSPGKVTDNF